MTNPLVTPRFAVAALLLVAACSTGPLEPAATAPTNDVPPTPSATAAAPTVASTPNLTTAPLPTVLVPASADDLAGLRYTCGGASFPIEVFEGPGDAELSDDPPAAVLGPLWPGGPAEWWLIDRTATAAEYIGLPEGGSYWYVRAELSDGQWRARNYGDCSLRADVRNATLNGWWIAKGSWPAADDRTLSITIRDECPHTIAGRLRDPIVRYGPRAIVIILTSESLGEPHPHCGDGSDQLADIALQIDQAVAGRSIFDGSEWPVRDAHKQTERLIFCCG